MLIKAVKITPQTKIKIYAKHKVTEDEIENVLLEGKPHFFKTKFRRYIAIGRWVRYITIIFKYDKKTKEAEIITAYPSSKWQIKLYKRKK